MGCARECTYFLRLREVWGYRIDGRMENEYQEEKEKEEEEEEKGKCMLGRDLVMKKEIR